VCFVLISLLVYSFLLPNSTCFFECSSCAWTWQGLGIPISHMTLTNDGAILTAACSQNLTKGPRLVVALSKQVFICICCTSNFLVLIRYVIKVSNKVMIRLDIECESVQLFMSDTWVERTPRYFGVRSRERNGWSLRLRSTNHGKTTSQTMPRQEEYVKFLLRFLHKLSCCSVVCFFVRCAGNENIDSVYEFCRKECFVSTIRYPRAVTVNF